MNAKMRITSYIKYELNNRMDMKSVFWTFLDDCNCARYEEVYEQMREIQVKKALHGLYSYQ